MEAELGGRPTEGKMEEFGPTKLPAVHKTPVVPRNPADVKFLEAWNKPQPVVCPYKLPDLEITVLRSGSTQEEVINKPATPVGPGKIGQASSKRRRGKKKGPADGVKQLDENQAKQDGQLVDVALGSVDGRTELDHDKAAKGIKTKVDVTEAKTTDDGKPDSSTNASALPLESKKQDNLQKPDQSEALDEKKVKDKKRDPEGCLDDDHKTRPFVLPVVGGCGCRCCRRAFEIANGALDGLARELAHLDTENKLLTKRSEKLDSMFRKLADERAQLIDKIDEYSLRCGPQEAVIRALREKVKDLKKRVEEQKEMIKAQDVELYQQDGQIQMNEVILEKVRDMQSDWIRVLNLAGEISQSTMLDGDSKTPFNEESIKKMLDRSLENTEVKTEASNLISVIQNMREVIQNLRAEVEQYKTGKLKGAKKEVGVGGSSDSKKL